MMQVSQPCGNLWNQANGSDDQILNQLASLGLKMGLSEADINAMKESTVRG